MSYFYPEDEGFCVYLMAKKTAVEDDIMAEVSPWGWPEMNRAGKKVKEK